MPDDPSGLNEVGASKQSRDDFTSRFDDGIGIDSESRVQALREGHLGLVSVNERSGALGGRLTVESLPGSGTRVSLEVDIDDREAQGKGLAGETPVARPP